MHVFEVASDCHVVPNRSRISMKCPNQMKVTTLASISNVDIDRLESPPDRMSLPVGKAAVGGHAPDRLTGETGRVSENTSGLPDRGTNDSSEKSRSDSKEDLHVINQQW